MHAPKPNQWELLLLPIALWKLIDFLNSHLFFSVFFLSSIKEWGEILELEDKIFYITFDFYPFVE